MVWHDPKYLSVLLNERKRHSIENWVCSIDSNVVAHENLDSDEIFEPNYDCEALIWDGNAVKEQGYLPANCRMIDFDCMENKENVLPSADDFTSERLTGFFSNMSGSTGVSRTDSSAQSVSDSESHPGSNSKNDSSASTSDSQSSEDHPRSCDEDTQGQSHPSNIDTKD